jgi:hypothetical protein
MKKRTLEHITETELESQAVFDSILKRDFQRGIPQRKRS